MKVIHNRLNNWRRLYPSRLGKNFVAKLSLYSCIWYYTQSMIMPPKVLATLKKMVATFIWKSNIHQELNQRCRSHTQHNKMCQLPKLGGCKFLDLESEVNAFATKWIQRLVDPSKAIWKDFIWSKISNIIDPFPS